MVWMIITKWVDIPGIEGDVEYKTVPHETRAPALLCPRCKTGELERKELGVVQAGRRPINLTGMKTYQCSECEAIVWEAEQ